MNKKQIFTRSVITAAIALASSQSMAAGFQLNAQSATGLGRAFSGDGVIADNASTMAKNAASMTLFDAPALSLGVIAIDTDVKVKDAKFMGALPVDDASIGGTSYAPNIYFIQPINDKFSVGASLYSNFGTKTEFPENYGKQYGGAPDLFGGLTDVKSVNLGLSAAYRLNQQFSIGGGLDVIYGSGKLERGNKSAVNIDADGVALGFNLGTIYELDQNNRFGLSYRYSPTLEAKGDMHYVGNNLSDQKLKMPLPDMAEFSGFNKLNDKFAVHYSIQWIRWSEFDKLETTGGTFSKAYEWQDGWHYSIGGTYYLNNDWTLRAGYMHDTSAQNQRTSISVPDSDRNWLSGGFSYHLDSKSTIDFGLTYLIGKDVKVDEPLADGSPVSVQATTRANAWLYGLQYSRSF
ncbi:aromatic hydrocarbon degradation protein [Photobacterium angustum]|uniref:Aromatic hydrocarbon degradation protein n=1 Tax=Photobacterium angustum TaxID=661 RepID=A0A855SH39_PHOAN|nr:outer membrane protein transport protein [Photobacterium angustum]KJF82832.1 aromatic hydrocarbon degradation protein [Photobacterium damselae subsp. damselae]KJG03696.1 aromatic hydrocarbon degradation protein [Photobacterium angustum]KJG18611.1 aromatic hydrocarbon degradation protein [Photobacterium angustum]KJG25827.1 aromatic hydrocarbon degradation protein [Photobacterium angustum]KJG34011.1 aromatic hydrocarbon degradation protein [Photobacterium angustum]